MNALIAIMDGGAEELLAWAVAEGQYGQRQLGNGAKPEKAIPAAARKAVTASAWQKTFTAQREAQKTAGKLWSLIDDGTRVYEDKMDGHSAYVIRALDAEGMWDRTLGMTYDDPRHPSRQGKGGAA